MMKTQKLQKGAFLNQKMILFYFFYKTYIVGTH